MWPETKWLCSIISSCLYLPCDGGKCGCSWQKVTGRKKWPLMRQYWNTSELNGCTVLSMVLILTTPSPPPSNAHNLLLNVLTGPGSMTVSHWALKHFSSKRCQTRTFDQMLVVVKKSMKRRLKQKKMTDKLNLNSVHFKTKAASDDLKIYFPLICLFFSHIISWCLLRMH